MCGIVGYIGEKRNLNFLIQALEKLEYRGYDSSGIAYWQEDKIEVKKAVGPISDLRKEVNENLFFTKGIAHTRWATHGKATRENAHPHTVGSFTVVHNGIIENYQKLKEQLQKEGYCFHTQTDTEVVAAFLDFLYQKISSFPEVLVEFQKQVVGSYALAILCFHSSSIWCLKKESPLVVGKIENGYFLTSDIHAFLKDTKEYFVLEDYEICELREDALHFYQKDGIEIQKENRIYEEEFVSSSKGDYEHYMLKEIMEESRIVSSLMNYYTSNDYEQLKRAIPDFSKYSRVQIIACGTAMHAGLIFQQFLERLLSLETQVFLASEFRYQTLFLDKKVLTIFISQSGETADTLKALQIAKEHGCDTFSIVNVFDSSISRISDYVLYTRCGEEVAVASTKAYVSQIFVACCLIQYLTKQKMDVSLPEKMRASYQEEIVKQLAKEMKDQEHVFFIGRGIDYALSQEAALKLKEVSYVHAESYAAGELKHGTISLIEEGTFVIGIATEERLLEKTINNLMEVKARGARVVLVIPHRLRRSFDFDYIIEVEDTDFLYQSILAILPLQLLAYYVAKERNCSIDQPKNLAKSVTVE